MGEVVLDDKFSVTEDFAIKYDDFDIIVEHKYFYTIDEATLDYITDKVLIHTLNLSTIK